MSEENVEIVRQAYDAVYSGDAEVALDLCDPDVVVDASRTQPDIGAHPDDALLLSRRLCYVRVPTGKEAGAVARRGE